uniref:NADH-ubiquinone oxidoreductase chain 1 n=1 Tax=Aleyrodes shizuokensis TaxID=860392 RepID=A0A7T1K7S5_9HEMI|nr:NADH dehydrogenase subunit 1 [Aleyrodes shizuokensis]QPO06183.1 NADH dehydrogenase subunit 1 [Aleyrodes shizuokensis]
MTKMMNMIILILTIMLSIAFFTLMERKLISYMQNRKGPNKVTMMGMLQPISDAIKLMSKELNLNMKSNFTMYMISPLMNIMCSMIMWMSFPFMFNFSFMKMSLLFLISCSSFNTITIMIMSWSSNSNYAFIGMMRTIAQLISYEINFMMIIIVMINLNEEININMMTKMQKYLPTLIFLPTLFTMWMLTILAETNRTPFDFSEGESELISGFNIEFSSNMFMLLFLAEYASILIMSFLTTNLFINFSPHTIPFMTTYLMMTSMFIWTRSTYPRFRYDKLMKLNWTQMLPSTMFTLFLLIMIKLYYTKKYHKN